MLHRLFPPPGPTRTIIAAGGRSYSGVPGNPQNVPDTDGLILAANGWAFISLAGTTVERPTANDNSAQYTAGSGTHFFDTTLNMGIVFDGSTWRDPVTGAAV